MKLIYSLFFVLLINSPLALAEVVYSTLTCPKTITIPGNSFVSTSISLSQTRDKIVDSVSISYIHGIPGGREGYINPSTEPLTLQLIRSVCAGDSMPQCDYERPSNANYGGPNGPGYRASSGYLSCSEEPNNSFLISSNTLTVTSNTSEVHADLSNNSETNHYTFNKADLGNISIRSIVAKNDKIYIASLKNIFIKEKGNFKNYPLVYYTKYQYDDNEINDIAVNDYDNIYATTTHAFLMGKKYLHFDRYFFSVADDRDNLAMDKRPPRQNIAIDNHGKVFFATHDGLILQKEYQNYYIPIPNDWYFQTILNKFFSNLVITSLFADEKGSIYIGAPEGLIILKQSDGIIDNVIPNTDVTCVGVLCVPFNASIRQYYNFYINNINYIYVDKNSVIYLATKDGLVIGTPYRDDYAFETIHMNRIGITGQISSLYVDAKGTIYVGSGPDSNQPLVIGKKDTQGNYSFNPINKNELNVSNISSIYVDDNQQIYVGTENDGLFIGTKDR